MNKLFKKLIIIITLIAALATCIFTPLTFWLSARNSDVNIDAIILSCSRIAKTSKDGKLSILCKYGNEEIADCWLVRLKVTHSRGKTIIGKGQTPTITEDGIPIIMNAGCTLLDFNLVNSDIPGVSIQRRAQDELKFIFSQWRNGESVELDLFLDISNNEKFEKTMLSTRRVINDGDVIFCFPNEYAEANRGLFLKIIYSLQKPVMITALALWLLLLIMMIIHDVWMKSQQISWFNSYHKSASLFLKEKITKEAYVFVKIGAYNDRDIYNTLLMPLGIEMWKSFEGQIPLRMHWLKDEEPKYTDLLNLKKRLAMVSSSCDSADTIVAFSFAIYLFIMSLNLLSK